MLQRTSSLLFVQIATLDAEIPEKLFYFLSSGSVLGILSTQNTSYEAQSEAFLQIVEPSRSPGQLAVV